MKTNFFAPVFILCAVLFINTACSGLKPESPVSDKKTPENTNTTPAQVNSSSDSAKSKEADSAAPKDIAGTYEVNGTNENGAGNYKGTLVVTDRDEVYQFSWDTAGKKYDGVGVQNKSAVAVAFTEGTNGTGCGVVLYKIGADGTLDGKAGYWGINQSETETAKRLSGSDLVGEYETKGTNTDGKDYTGKLAVKTRGTGYAFSWTGANALEGFGIRQGDFVAVGIGGSKCGFVSYIIKSDGTLDGKWGGYGSTNVGTETAKKK